MSKNKLSRLLPCLAAGAALLLAASPATVVAQPPPPGTPPAGAPGAPPPGAPPGGFKFPGLPRQGFDNNGQNPASYNADEKAAVAVAEKWIETIKDVYKRQARYRPTSPAVGTWSEHPSARMCRPLLSRSIPRA